MAMKNLAQKKLIGYLVGILFVCFWAVFSIFSYDIAMLLTMITFVYCQVIEGLEFKELGNMMKFRIRIVIAVLLVIAILILFIIKL